MIKNEANQAFHAIAFNASGRVTGEAANITCTLAVDGGARGGVAVGNPTEIGTSGEYVFGLLQAESNGHELSFDPVCSVGGVQMVGVPSNVIYTKTADIDANLVAILDEVLRIQRTTDPLDRGAAAKWSVGGNDASVTIENP